MVSVKAQGDSGTLIISLYVQAIPLIFHFQGVANIASVSLSIGYPTVVSVPHSIVNGFKRLLALAAVTDITFKEAETLKEYLAVSENTYIIHSRFLVQPT